ncbi:MAG: peptidase M14, partial [Planctomycetes bacterium]|nr:peptidase M14 [Planctomycetota bacterium]
MKRNTILWSALILLIPTVAQAQEAGGIWRPQVEIPWNRYYRHAELNDMLVRLQTQWPGFCEIETIGESYEGRSMNVLILPDQSTGDADSKPAMWVDGNVHGNEVQGGEAAVYLAWWLLEHKDTNPRA